MKKGDNIIFINNDFDFTRTFNYKITSIHNYNSFEEYLSSETLKRCLLEIDIIDEGVKIYYKYYKKEDEDKYKIRAFRLRVIKNY